MRLLLVLLAAICVIVNGSKVEEAKPVQPKDVVKTEKVKETKKVHKKPAPAKQIIKKKDEEICSVVSACRICSFRELEKVEVC
jgi:hypothetical protein